MATVEAGLMFVLFVLIVQCVPVLTEGMDKNCVIAEAIQYVATRPKNEIEWKEAARRKNCSSYFDNCIDHPKGPLAYHCLVERNTTKLVELCARIWHSQGHCVDFNADNRRIESNYEARCSPDCPSRFISTEIYKYKSCFPLEDEEKIFRKTPSPTINSKFHNSSSVKDYYDTYTNYKMEIMLIISITMNAVAVIALLAIVVKHYIKSKHNRRLPTDDIEMGSTSRTVTSNASTQADQK